MLGKSREEEMWLTLNDSHQRPEYEKKKKKRFFPFEVKTLTSVRVPEIKNALRQTHFHLNHLRLKSLTHTHTHSSRTVV